MCVYIYTHTYTYTHMYMYIQWNIIQPSKRIEYCHLWEAWWASVHGVAQSRTRLKRLSSSSRSRSYTYGQPHIMVSTLPPCQRTGDPLACLWIHLHIGPVFPIISHFLRSQTPPLYSNRSTMAALSFLSYCIH